MIEVIIIKTNGDKFDISPLVEKITWSGDYKQSARKLEFSLMASSADINVANVDITLGSIVVFYEDKKEIFRGTIFTRSKDSSENSIDYLAYDRGIYLLKNKGAYNFTDTPAEKIVSKIAEDYKFTIGNVVGTKINVTKIFMDVNLYEIIMSSYTIASKENKKKYMCFFKQDKFYVEEKGTTKLKIAFEEGVNIKSTDYSESIEDIVNKVLVVDESGNKVAEYKKDNIPLYGTFQDILQAKDGEDTKKQAEKKFKDIEKSCSLSGYGDTSCITGYGVEVKDSYTGLVGIFYVDSDKHNWKKGEYSIDLKLNFQNIMDEHEAGKDEVEENEEFEGGTTLNGSKVKALFTAYYPHNSKMEGGYYDCQGNRLNPSKKTCAAPKSVPLGTKIQVQGTGTSRDGEVYTVNDRGGAIKIRNGVYQFDLLMSSASECNRWGRKNGSAILGDGTGYSKGSIGGYNATGKAADLLRVAMSKRGKRYVWGATGPNTFDCSGLTQWSHKQIGIKIPRVARAQAASGKSISKSAMKPGDLVFFKKGKNPVHHVGIYVGNGEFLHAPQTGDVVKISKLSSRRDFYSVRRYV